MCFVGRFVLFECITTLYGQLKIYTNLYACFMLALCLLYALLYSSTENALFGGSDFDEVK